MFNPQHFRATTSWFIASIISAIPIANVVNITPASAQLFPPQEQPIRNNQRNNNLSSEIIPRNFVIPVGYEQDKILVTPEETAPITLTVAANIRDSDHNTLIPYGSEIVGKIEPAGDGSRFVAEELIFPDGTSYYIDASSQVVTRRETVKKGADAGDILKGAAIGSAAAVVLSEIFGDIDFLEVLGGAGAGAVAGLLLGGNEAELVSIDPNNDLALTLQSDLSLR
jgi:hypothetical protein